MSGRRGPDRYHSTVFEKRVDSLSTPRDVRQSDAECKQKKTSKQHSAVVAEPRILFPEAGGRFASEVLWYRHPDRKTERAVALCPTADSSSPPVDPVETFWQFRIKIDSQCLVLGIVRIRPSCSEGFTVSVQVFA